MPGLSKWFTLTNKKRNNHIYYFIKFVMLQQKYVLTKNNPANIFWSSTRLQHSNYSSSKYVLKTS